LHPVSCLTSLTRAEKQTLLERGVVLVKDLIDNPYILEQCKISDRRSGSILEEASAVTSQ
jgi:hypothetical protein